MNRRDWRTASTGDVKVDVHEVQTALVPMLRSTVAPARGIVRAWTEQLVAECRERLSVILPLSDDELEFLRRLNDEGEIALALLTGDARMQAIIQQHPGLRWKALNVRHHFFDGWLRQVGALRRVA